MGQGCKHRGFGRGVQPAAPNSPKVLDAWLILLHHLFFLSRMSSKFSPKYHNFYIEIELYDLWVCLGRDFRCLRGTEEARPPSKPHPSNGEPEKGWDGAETTPPLNRCS